MTGYSEEICIREVLGETIRSLTENQDERNQMIREACSMLYGFDGKYKAEFNKKVEILESFLVQYNPENVTLNLFDSKTHKTILRNKVLQKSAQLAITAHLWSSCSTEKYVDNLLLLQKDGRAAISCTGLIEAYLNTGLCYDTHQIMLL